MNYNMEKKKVKAWILLNKERNPNFISNDNYEITRDKPSVTLAEEKVVRCEIIYTI